MTKFIYRVQNLLAERGETLNDLSHGSGVSRRTVYRGIKSKSMIAAIAYYFGTSAEELVAGTELEKIWEEDTSEY